MFRLPRAFVVFVVVVFIVVVVVANVVTIATTKSGQVVSLSLNFEARNKIKASKRVQSRILIIPIHPRLVLKKGEIDDLSLKKNTTTVLFFFVFFFFVCVTPDPQTRLVKSLCMDRNGFWGLGFRACVQNLYVVQRHHYHHNLRLFGKTTAQPNQPNQREERARARERRRRVLPFWCCCCASGKKESVERPNNLFVVVFETSEISLGIPFKKS